MTTRGCYESRRVGQEVLAGQDFKVAEAGVSQRILIKGTTH